MSPPPIVGLPVCSIEEMQRMEKKAIAKGLSEKKLMEAAGRHIALAAEDFIIQKHLSPTIALLAGKGNNGADAYVAGCHLLEKGFSVIAYHVGSLEEVSPLNKEQRDRFLQKGGTIENILEEEEMFFADRGLIIDGLLGTGVTGKLSKLYERVISAVNASEKKVLSIDLPSGLNKGSIEGSIQDDLSACLMIKADITLCLGLAKTELFYSPGYAHAGEIFCVDIGFSKEDIQEVKGDFFLLDEAAVASLLPQIQRVRNKYSAGFVVGIAGSPGMEGAAKLASLAALRSGAGIVKLFTTPSMDMGDAPYELVQIDRQKESNHIADICNGASALFWGPGLGREEQEEERIMEVLPHIAIPTVLDADALYSIAQHPDIVLPKASLFTPHRKEMQRLLGLEFFTREKELFSLCQSYVNKRNITLILKGAPTFIFAPSTMPIVIPRGDPGLATAGTGDVLTGILAALLAQGLSCNEAAVLGVFLQGISGEIAAIDKTSYSLIASDVIVALPAAIKRLQRLRD